MAYYGNPALSCPIAVFRTPEGHYPVPIASRHRLQRPTPSKRIGVKWLSSKPYTVESCVWPFIAHNAVSDTRALDTNIICRYVHKN